MEMIPIEMKHHFIKSINDTILLSNDETAKNGVILQIVEKIILYCETLWQKHSEEELQHISNFIMKSTPILGNEKTPASFRKFLSFIFNKVERYLKFDAAAVHQLISNQINISDIINDLKDKKMKNNNVFDGITEHHKYIGKFDWMEVCSFNNQLDLYSMAASQMGEKPWVIAGNNWIIENIMQYFCKGGAKKSFLKQIKQHLLSKKTLVEDEDMKLINLLKDEILANNLFLHLESINDSYLGQDVQENTIQSTKKMKKTSENIILNSFRYSNKIKIIDVGSCYNPFAICPYHQQLEIIALDLYPSSTANGIVYQCDFINTPIIKEDDHEMMEMDSVTNLLHLKQLPDSSADAVTMSLVLSYLPTPQLRMKMIKQAWKGLIKPHSVATNIEDYWQQYKTCLESSDMSIPNDWREYAPHHQGILLIYEKESIFHNEKYYNKFLNNWKEVIENCGFKLEKYEKVRTKSQSRINQKCGSDTRIGHAFMFRVQQNSEVIANVKLSANNLTKLLWIKQDFDSPRDDGYTLENIF